MKKIYEKSLLLSSKMFSQQNDFLILQKIMNLTPEVCSAPLEKQNMVLMSCIGPHSTS